MRIGIAWVIGILLLFSCKKNAEATKPVVENITESVYASGLVKSKNQYQVFSVVSGIITNVKVTENDVVQPGTPLFVISDNATRLNRQNAGLAAAFADVATNQDKLQEAKNAIALAKAKYQNDSSLFRRQQNLWSQGIGSRYELEQRELALKNAETAVEAANIRYKELLRQIQFNAAQSRNSLAISNYREGDLTVKSEISGKVYSILKEKGEMVNPQTPLAIVGDASNFFLEMQVDELDIIKIKPGQQVLVKMESYNEEVFVATVTRINPLMNDRTRSFVVEAMFEQQPAVLYPNLSAEANIVIQTKEKALTIPRQYLVNDSLVLVEAGKTRPVTTGLKDYKKVEIISGLSANDVIYKPQ